MTPSGPIATAFLCWVLAACALSDCSRGSQSPKPQFREEAAETDLRFRHFTGATGQYYLPEIMGSGVALLDYDGDGNLEVFLVQGTVMEQGKTPAGSLFPPSAESKPSNRLFRNMLKEAGKLQFVDVTEQAGLAFTGYGMGVATGDYNNDGHPDCTSPTLARTSFTRTMATLRSATSLEKPA